MPIPAFSINGVLPPFIGANPGDAAHLMTPYRATAVEMVQRFGTTPHRLHILAGWLAFRHALRGAGLTNGFQWANGSFTEDKVPGDIDVVTFCFLPNFADAAAQAQFVKANTHLFFRPEAKLQYSVDAMYVQLNGTPETVVDVSAYYLGLFSHQRVSLLWKGMVNVSLNDPADDVAALNELVLRGGAPR